MKYIVTTFIFILLGCGIAQAKEDIFYSGKTPNSSGIHAEDYIKKADIYFQAEEYDAAINLYRKCYQRTEDLLCISSMENKFTPGLEFLSDCNKLIDLSDEYGKRIKKQVENDEMKIKGKFYFHQKVIFPEVFSVFNQRYANAKYDLEKIVIIRDTFNVYKMFSQVAREAYDNCSVGSSNEAFCAKQLQGYIKFERMLKKYYEVVMSYIVRLTLNAAHNKISEARNLIKFNDKNLLREAAQLMGQFDGDLIKTCNQDTRMFFVEVYTYLKKSSPSSLMEEFKILNTLQSNVNTGRTGADLWWSK